MHVLGIISVTFCILLAGLYQKQKRKDWLAPGPFWALVCFIMVAIPLLSVSFSVSFIQVSALAISWIFGSVFCVYAGGLLALNFIDKENEKKHSQENQFPGLALLILGGSLLGITALFVQFKMLGYSPLDIFFPSKYYAIIQELRPLHLQNKVPAYVSAMTGGVYLAGMLGGFYYVARGERVWRYLAFMPFIPATATAYFVTTKLSFLFPLLFWIGSYLAAHVYFGRAITRKTLIRFAYVFIAICLLMIILILARWISWSPRVGQLPFGGWEGFLKYSFTMVAGHIVTFSNWFPTYISSLPDGYGWGRYTVAGIYDYFGYAARLPADSIVIFSGPGNNTSNVYTVFRPLILDYGLLGSIFIFIAAGFLAEYAFNRLKRGGLRWLPVMAAFYWTTLWNYNSSIFNYNSILLAFFFFSCYFIAIPYLNKILTIAKPNTYQEEKQ